MSCRYKETLVNFSYKYVKLMPIPCQIGRYIQISWLPFVHLETSCAQVKMDTAPPPLLIFPSWASVSSLESWYIQEAGDNGEAVEREEVRITSLDCKTMTRTSHPGETRRGARPNETSSHFNREMLKSVGRTIFAHSLRTIHTFSFVDKERGRTWRRPRPIRE